MNNNWNQCDYKATMYVGVYYGTRVDFYFWFSELGFDYDKEVKNFYFFFFSSRMLANFVHFCSVHSSCSSLCCWMIISPDILKNKKKIVCWSFYSVWSKTIKTKLPISRVWIWNLCKTGNFFGYTLLVFNIWHGSTYKRW